MLNKINNSQSYIYNAILKHGHSNFSLTIMEYCSPEQCIEREDFYLSSLPHEYNILPKAGSSFGFKHSEKTKKIISEAKKGENHPNYGKPRYEGALRFFNKKDVPLKQ
jgi:group I intron endonuclease